MPYRDIVTLIIPEHLSYTGAGSNTNWVDASGTNWKYGITANGNGDPAVFSNDAHGTFSVNVNSAVTIGKLTADGLGGATQWNFSGSGIITLQGAGTPIIESDVNTIISAPISGTQGLRKTGNAQLLLSGSLNYTGQTIVDAGTLQINTDRSSVARRYHRGGRIGRRQWRQFNNLKRELDQCKRFDYCRRLNSW